MVTRLEDWGQFRMVHFIYHGIRAWQRMCMRAADFHWPSCEPISAAPIAQCWSCDYVWSSDHLCDHVILGYLSCDRSDANELWGRGLDEKLIMWQSCDYQVVGTPCDYYTNQRIMGTGCTHTRGSHELMRGRHSAFYHRHQPTTFNYDASSKADNFCIIIYMFNLFLYAKYHILFY